MTEKTATVSALEEILMLTRQVICNLEQTPLSAEDRHDTTLHQLDLIMKKEHDRDKIWPGALASLRRLCQRTVKSTPLFNRWWMSVVSFEIYCLDQIVMNAAIVVLAKGRDCWTDIQKEIERRVEAVRLEADQQLLPKTDISQLMEALEYRVLQPLEKLQKRLAA